MSAPLLGEPLPVELMNTVWADRGRVHDALDTPQQVADWLADVTDRLEIPVDVELGSISVANLRRTWSMARDLRDALRSLAADRTGDDRPAALARTDGHRAVAVLNATAARAPRWAVLELPAHGGPPRRTIRSAKPVADAAISQIADEGVALFSGADGSALRACYAPGCVLYFVRQHPRREWCSAACGNRARVARHYERRNAVGGC